MRRTSFVSVFFVLLLCLAVFGYLRGWFVVSSHPDNSSNKVDFQLTVDPDKAKADTDEAVARVTEAVKEGAETLNVKARETTQPAK